MLNYAAYNQVMSTIYLQPCQEPPWHQSKQELHSHPHEGGRSQAGSHIALAVPQNTSFASASGIYTKYAEIWVVCFIFIGTVVLTSVTFQYH